MAWPSTPLTTYIANSTPSIKAFDLNAMQTGTNGIINGTYNLQAVTVTTGTPGSVVAPVAGDITSINASNIGLLNSTTVSVENASNDAALTTGGLAFLGTDSQPAYNVGLQNKLTSIGFVKAWALLTTDGAGGLTLEDGSNILTAALVAANPKIRVDFQSGMTNGNYVVMVYGDDASGVSRVLESSCILGARAAGNVTITFANDPHTTAMTIDVWILGRQPA